MARIRTIKPEFWTSGQVMECSANARLMFIGLWNFADDAGRHPDNAKQIKAEIFPGDDVLLDSVRGMIDELSANGLLTRYTVDGKGYLQITGWHHQRIDKPQKPRYPGPDQDNSENVPRTVDDDSCRILYEGKDTREEDSRRGDESPPKDLIWNVGVDLLTSAGEKNQSARSFLGKLCKQFGDDQVREAVGRAVAVAPAEPKAWLQGALKNGSGADFDDGVYT